MLSCSVNKYVTKMKLKTLRLPNYKTEISDYWYSLIRRSNLEGQLLGLYFSPVSNYSVALSYQSRPCNFMFSTIEDLYLCLSNVVLWIY